MVLLEFSSFDFIRFRIISKTFMSLQNAADDAVVDVIRVVVFEDPVVVVVVVATIRLNSTKLLGIPQRSEFTGPSLATGMPLAKYKFLGCFYIYHCGP
jgi:hypothetical protein